MVKIENLQPRGHGFEPHRYIVESLKAKVLHKQTVKCIKKGSQMKHTKKKKICLSQVILQFL